MLTDVYLYPPAAAPNDIILSWGLRPVTPATAPDIFFPQRHDSRGQPVWAGSLYASLVRQYGLADGERIYYAMAHEQKGPFASGAKYAARRPSEPSVPAKPQLVVDRQTAAVAPLPPAPLRSISPPPRRN